MHEEVSKYLLKLRRDHPFLASISLFADYLFTDQVDAFDTNGKTIRIETDYFYDLDEDERPGILLHTVLHCALLHTVRRGTRDKQLWNVASDIVVNNIILEGSSITVPYDTVSDRSHSGSSVEQVYEALSKSHQWEQSQDAQESDDWSEGNQTSNAAVDGNEEDLASEFQENSALSDFQRDLDYTDDTNRSPNQSQDKQLEGHWKGAIQRALIADQMNPSKSRGSIPAGLQREIDAITNPELDWRTLLWKFLVRTPNDFQGFDRRFLHAGLYLDHLEGESVDVDVAVDTSGSIDDFELRQFLSEVTAITRAYSHLNARIYYVDAEVYGPFPLESQMEIEAPIGGGGTDFSTFFALTKDIDQQSQPPVCVYFTDGDGAFPAQHPKRAVLWVVTKSGMPNEYFPFGDVARLINT